MNRGLCISVGCCAIVAACLLPGWLPAQDAPPLAARPAPDAKLVELYQELIKVHEEQIVSAGKLLEVGGAQPADAIKWHRQLADARVRLALLQGQKDVAMRHLSALLEVYETHIARTMRLHEQGRLGWDGITDARAEMIEVRIRLVELENPPAATPR